MNLTYPYSSLKLAFESSDHWFVHCPFHQDTNASCCINKKTLGDKPYQQYLYYTCFGCGECGTAKSFAQQYLQHDLKSISLNLMGEKTLRKFTPQPKINWDTLR